MSSISVSKDISFDITDEEKEILTKARDILEDMRHSWYMKDDDAWGDERYWELENTVKFLKDTFDLKEKE